MAPGMDPGLYSIHVVVEYNPAGSEIICRQIIQIMQQAHHGESLIQGILDNNVFIFFLPTSQRAFNKNCILHCISKGIIIHHFSNILTHMVPL